MSRPITLPNPSISEPSFADVKALLDRNKLNLSASHYFGNRSPASPLDELVQSTRSTRVSVEDGEEVERDIRTDQTGTTSTTLTEGDPFGESLMSMSYSYAHTSNARPMGAEKKHGFFDSSLDTSFFRGLNCSLGEKQLLKFRINCI